MNAKTKEGRAMEHDFKAYINGIVIDKHGAYACSYCKYGKVLRCDICHKHCDKRNVVPETLDELSCHKDCDGASHWEWRGVCADNDDIR